MSIDEPTDLPLVNLMGVMAQDFGRLVGNREVAVI